MIKINISSFLKSNIGVESKFREGGERCRDIIVMFQIGLKLQEDVIVTFASYTAIDVVQVWFSFGKLSTRMLRLENA
jgi:hypothetical protein